ncbi:uncharacterized protein [Porites lutea]|uniref:uncharacterized protein n=1 Tax=Porites lutea TaxID=51062 RepID=UPI003CC61A67
MHEKAAVTGLLFNIFFLGLIRKAATTDQCNGPRQIPIRGKMLKGHIYETRWVRSGYAECLFVCREEKVCQSFNFVVKESKCEFNNRTKEACSPEDFVSDPHRLYVKLDVSRVPLGSIPELPATSCQEINKNEGKKLDSGKYWMSLSGKIDHVYCNMSTVPEDIDECKSEIHDCHVKASCINTLSSYNCTCRPGYKGNGTICTDIDECKNESHDCHVNANCTNTLGSYNCSCWPGYKGNGTICTAPWSFTTNGQGRNGSIQTFTVPKTTRYRIRAWGARGGTHSTNYGSYPGTYYGGKGAYKEGTFTFNKGTVLNIVVGQRGGDSVEVKEGRSTNMTAAQLGLSVEDNAGTGGGGGSFVYTTSNVLLLAAGGGGGASSGYNGVDGQSGTSGTSSVGRGSSQVRSGGSGGNPGHCNSAGASYHGGVGAGWSGQGCSRAGPPHGERGGSRAQGWVGGRAGMMNSGNNGGPPPGAVGGFGGGGGGSEDNGASGGGGGYSGGGSGTYPNQAGGGGGSYCRGSNCSGVSGGNSNDNGFVKIVELSD